MKINLPPENVWIVSDTHFWHKNICNGTSTWSGGGMRDYPDEVTMSEDVAKKINDKVKEDHALIIPGDFAFGNKEKIIKAREMIDCKTIYLVLGNHDYTIIEKDLRYLFTKTWGEKDVSCIVKFDIGGKRYVVSHYALRVWEDSHHGVRNLYAHSHGTLPEDPNALAFDAGIDANEDYPMNFVQIEERMSKKIYIPADHHNPLTN